MALDGAKFICLSDVTAADATETTPTTATGVEAGGIGDVSTSENIVIEAKGRKFTVGYYMNCDYVLEDPRANGVHCEIQCDAFGRVTIHNNSDVHPISVNEQIITLKRPLLDGSRIKILDRNFLWKFPKPLEVTATSKSTQGYDVTSNDTVMTPQKLVAVPEQAPNSCPDLKHHRKVDKRFTVHNFAYCINSDEEGNTSSELPSINESENVEDAAISELVTQKQSHKNEGMPVEDKEILPTSIASKDSVVDKTTFETSKVERRSITPEPQKNEPPIASTPLIKFEGTPKMNVINYTQNKENRSTEKTLRLLSFCQQSDVVITSFSPRETGVRIEKSFTAVVKPATLGSTTPKSVYSTPKSMLSDYNDGESINFIDFATPATSKKGARVFSRNSSMHLIDLTTPSKLALDSSRQRLVHKGNKTLPSHVKLSTTLTSSDKLKDDSTQTENAHLLSSTPTLGTPLNKSETPPQSDESVINVDESSDSSSAVIEISDNSPTSSTSSPVRTGFVTKTPQRPTGQKPFTSTPLRTPQSLLKRAIVTSAKKQINSSLRSALGKATPAHNRKLNTTAIAETTTSTPKSRIYIGSPGSVAAAQRRNVSSLTRSSSVAPSHNKEHVITPSSTSLTRLSQDRKIPASASRLNTVKRTSPLRGVRKSFGGTTLTSHISKTRRSVISPRKHSPTSIATKLAAKARKSFIPNSQNNKKVASRAQSLVAAAVTTKNSASNTKPTDTTSQKNEIVKTVENITGKEVKIEASFEEQNEIDDLSCTFTVDDSLEEVQIKTTNLSTVCVEDASTSQKQDLHKTFSPEKSLTATECKVPLDVTVDIAETSIESHKEGILEDLNDKDEIIIAEHISESFAEVVDAGVKIEEEIKSSETIVNVEQRNDIVDETSKMSVSPSEQQQDLKMIEGHVIETLDTSEINNVSVEQQVSTTTEAHVLTPPSSSDTIDSEGMPKPSGESQGTAELLEEIEYVLNKSDELQQQLIKDVHTSSIEATKELINFKNSKANVKDELATSTSHSVVPTSTDRPELQEDASSIDSNIIPATSDITSTDLDASSIQTELSITSIATPSEFDVSTIESSSVTKSIVPDERETIDEKTQSSNKENCKAAVDLEAKDTESSTSIKTELSVADAAEAESVARVESTTDEVEYIVFTTIGNAEEDSISESKFAEIPKDSQTTLTDAAEIESVAEEGSVNKSKVDVVTSIRITGKNSQTTLELSEETEQTQAVFMTQTDSSAVNNDIQQTTDDNKETDITETQPKQNTTEHLQSENGPAELEECKFLATESKMEFKTLQNAEKTIEETKSLSKSSETITAESEPDSVTEEKIKSDEENQIATNSERNSDSEKENNILVEEGKTISTNTAADDTKKLSSSEPKTPNLCGIRDMLRTPKLKEATTPRFVGLRNLIRTPKASTSAAAAVIENDPEELIGVQKLLKTPHFDKIKPQTPQNTAEDNKFTPRRSTRRRASANPELTPTPKPVIETDDTPRRTTRRRASAAAEVNYTPQRVTRRRPSLALDNEGVAAAALTSIKRVGLYAKRPGTIANTTVAEDMGAIIEEDPKECVEESYVRQQDSVETKKEKKDVKTETNVHDLPEVIEESICEEVNPHKQEVKEQKEDVVEDKPNKECEKAKESKDDIESICAEKLDKDVDQAEIATESQSQPTHKTQEEETVAASSCNVSEVHKEDCLTETKGITAVKTEKTADILDESDYEYGKEVMEEIAATALTDAQPKTPKTDRKSVRIADSIITESPKTPVMVGMRELLKTPKHCRDTPMLIGVRDLVRTPKPTIASRTTDVVDDAEQLTGLADLMKTPKVPIKHCETVESTEGDDEPSTSTKSHSDFIGMREILKTPQHTSTPYYSGMREMLRTPKAYSTPQLAGVRELMQTPKRTKLNVEYDDQNEELDQFFKTPRAKNIMIPTDPASAILEPSSDSSAEIMMAATTEYDLHSSSQRPLEDIDIYKTPVSARLTNVGIEQSETKTCQIEAKKDESLTDTTNKFEVSVPETPVANCDNKSKATTSKRNLSAEEAFDEMVGMRTILDVSPPLKVYSRKQQSIVAISPFSATDVISDLPKTDVQEWVDNLEQESESVVEEQEFTATSSILDASKATNDPIAASMYEKSGISMNKDTTEELLADMSAVSSMVDPLEPSAMKTSKSLLTIVVDENETLRPVTPINTEISGINLLDRTTESVFSEPLVVSDTESLQLEENETDEVETENTINKSATEAKNLQDREEFPIMFVDSSDSEQEEDVKATEKSDLRKAELKSPIANMKSITEEEIIELDNESHINVTTKSAHKSNAGQHMRASTPNRNVMQSTRERRQSMGAEQLITKVSIDISLEKSRLTKEKSADATTAKDNLAKIEEESANNSENETDIIKVIPDDGNATAITTASNHDESDFSNFLENKSITSREKRGMTPDQFNKSRSQKITEGRRLTLGAEHHLPNVTIDFVEEKLKLEQLTQKPPCIDESPTERDDSFNAGTTEVAETEENTAGVKISASGPKEIAHDTNNTEEVDDEDMVDVKSQMDREENANEIEENILDMSLKETGKISDEAEKDSVQDLDSKIPSGDKDDAQTTAIVVEPSAEESQNDVMDSENIEGNIADVCESAVVEDITVATIKEDNVSKAENIDIAATSSNLSKKATVSRENAPTFSLIDEEETKSKDTEETTESSVSHSKSEYAGNKLEVEFESTNVEEITSAESTKEKNDKLTENTDIPPTTTLTEDAIKTPEENKLEMTKDTVDKDEVQSIISTVRIRSEEQKSEEAPGSTKVEENEAEASSSNENKNKEKEEGADHLVADNVGLETPKLQKDSLKVSLKTDRNEFNESDIFDLTEELSNETPTINTTQGVISDLTEEYVESIAETNTAENAIQDEQKPHHVTESKPVKPTETAEDNKETVEGKTERTTTNADQEIALSEEVPPQMEIIEVTDVEELEASTDEMLSLATNTSTDNEAFTLAISTESELEIVDGMSEVAVENLKPSGEAAQEMPAVKADIKNEVEKPNNQPVQADDEDVIGENARNTAEGSESLFLESKAILQGKGAVAESHSDGEDIMIEPVTKNSRESTSVTTVETELSETHLEYRKAENESDNTTSNTSTADEIQVSDNKYSIEADRTDIEECVVPEDPIPSTISSIAVETEIANKETKVNEALEVVNEEDNESKQSPNKPLAGEPAGVGDEVKEETAAEILEIPVEVAEQPTPVNQEKSEIIEDSKEIGAQLARSKQIVKENDEAEIIPPNADSKISEVVKQSAESFTDEINIPKEESHEKVLVEESTKSIEVEVQVSKLLNKNEIDVSVLNTPAEENIEEEQIETPTFSGKQHPTKRGVLKPSKQREEEHTCKSVIESKLSIEEEVSVDAQTYIDTEEDGKVKQTDAVESQANTQPELEQISKVAESGKDVTQISVKEVSDLSENLDTVATQHEESVETRLPSKRRGRKPSHSKRIAEENVAFVSTITIEKTKSLEELIVSDERKEHTVTSSLEESSSDIVETIADAPIATSTRHKTEKEFYKKVNYDICLSESAETAYDVTTDKPVDLELPDQSEKLIIDDKNAERLEVVDIATGTAIHEEIDAQTNSMAEEVPEPRRARRIRKASQSSQCSVHDEDHLPTTTTRRRGGRRRADTPLEHIATEVTTSDASSVKRRRQSQDKVVEDKPIEEIQVGKIDESEIAIVEGVIEIGNTSEESGASIKDHSGNINTDVKKTEDDQLEGAVSSATSKGQNATLTKGPSRRRRVAKTTDKIDGGVVTDSHHSDVDELSNKPVATKRSRRKQTHSESSQTSITFENIESHATKRGKRGYNATSDKSTINEPMEGTENNILHKNVEASQSKDDDTTIVTELQTRTNLVETEVSSVAEGVIKRDTDAIKTESKTEEEHTTAAETSKRTRNKRIHKTSEISISNKELPDETNDLTADPYDQKTVVELNEPLKTVVETNNTIAESVGGRRGRRGAAAVATVAINEVSSAHKRGALRGRSHQIKTQASQKEEETKVATDAKLQTETVTDHDEMPTVVEEKKQHKSVRRRRISLKETQASLGDTAEEGEGVEKIETKDDLGSSTKIAPKRTRRKSYHADEQQMLHDEAPTSAPTVSAAAPSKQRSRRKRKDSHQSLNDVVVGDEPPNKRPLSRKRRDSSLDSSIHEGTGMDMDINHGANTSSSSTTPQRPRRAAAAQDRNYDESSDAEAQVDLKRRIEKASLPKASTSSIVATTSSSSKQRSPTTNKTPTKEMVPAVITAKTTSTPILSTVITTSRGRQRKPTARVQQYLEEERAKAETPKKRLLIGSAAIGDTPTSRTVGTPARRTRKTSTVEMVGTDTVHTPARSRTRTAKALNVAETSEEYRSEVEHTHSELETTHSSSHVEDKEQITKAAVKKRPTRGRGKHPIAAPATTAVENETSSEPVEATHSGRVGRAAKAAAAAALITDDPIGSHTKARGGRTRRGADIAATEIVQPSDAEVKEVRTEVVVTPATDVEQTNRKTRKAAAGGFTTRGGRGRKKQQDHDDNTNERTTQHASLADGEASSQLPIIADADDEHEDDEETLITEAADIEVAKSLAGAKLAGKKRTAATRKAAATTARTAESPAPKRGRRRAVAASVEEDETIPHLDTRAESAASTRSRKMVRFDAATPSSVASATMSVDTAPEEAEEVTSAPAKRATRSRRK